ncbi:MAG: hypothetical protein ABIJ47_09160 [Candidatus Bathyarchaeota archaeon]
MEHVAIMRKSLGFLEKISEGSKKIESRWYITKYAPWGKIREGDVIYFKNSGEPITIKSNVKRVEFYSDLKPDKAEELLLKYGPEDGIGIENIGDFYQSVKDKKYCILVFLSNVENVEPFEIDKSGFGAMSSWISVKDVNSIKKGSDTLIKQTQILEY